MYRPIRIKDVLPEDNFEHTEGAQCPCEPTPHTTTDSAGEYTYWLHQIVGIKEIS